MLVTVVVVALVGAVLVRRVPWVHDRLPPPASTASMACAAAVVTQLLADESVGWRRAVLAGGLTIALATLLMLLAGLVVELILRPARRRAHRYQGASLRERVVRRADASTLLVRGWNLTAVTVRSGLRASDVRVTGLAAEMSYYALISLVPIATALGSSLGLLRRVLGDEQVEEIRASIVDGLTTIFAEQVAGDILAPLVDGLLSESSTSVAIGALLITLYLASRVFRAAVRALDDAYRVSSRRNVVAQYLLGLAFTIGALVTVVTVALLLVVGPLVGGGQAVVETFGLNEAVQVVWDVLRWPVAFGLGLTFLTLLYRYAPNVRTHWRRCLPGAVIGALGVLLVSTGFALYVRLLAPDALQAGASNALVVQAAAQMLSLVLAGVLWLWLASIAVLLGGIVNAEIHEERRLSSPPDAGTVGQVL